MKHEIGQILFLMEKSRATLLPARVIQEVSIRSLEGEKAEYTVEVVTGDGVESIRKIKLPNEKVVVFDSLDLARQSMLDNATNAINDLCNKANNLAAVLVPHSETIDNQHSHLSESIESFNHEPVQDQQTVILDDGTVAKVNLPQELGQ